MERASKTRGAGSIPVSPAKLGKAIGKPAGCNPALIRSIRIPGSTEGAAEWSATGLENQGMAALTVIGVRFLRSRPKKCNAT